MLRFGLRAMAMALVVACLGPVAQAQAQAQARDEAPREPVVRDIRSLNYTEKQQLLDRIRKALRNALDHTQPFPGQATYTPLKVKFRADARKEVLVIDIGAANGPFSGSADMSELGGVLENAAIEILDELNISHPAFDYEFSGRDWYYYNPEELQYQREYERRMQLKDGQSVIPPQGAKVAISAMHGYYWRLVDKVWKLQRPTESNGIYEDFITPEFVDPLKGYLLSRSNVALIGLPRNQSSDAHPDSGYPWWQMDGRENLEVLYPDNPEIWHSLSVPKQGRYKLWQYDDDINSRPLFANHIGADALFNLHTNAAGPSASGTRAYVAFNRPYDLALANNILCGMKELIHAQDAYKTFTIEDQAEESRKYGENGLALMPAVVLEVAFHTNASDAAALQDPVFVDAAMKGVEKGFRLQAEGKLCEPFKIDQIPDVSGPQNVHIPVAVHYKGYPQFAVKALVEIVSCPTGWDCTGGEANFPDPVPSPLTYTFSCTVTQPLPTATFGMRTTLVDIDGVKTDPVEHNISCTPTAQPATNAPVGKPVARVGLG
jgi:hypothetical protein